MHPTRTAFYLFGVLALVLSRSDAAQSYQAFRPDLPAGSGYTLDARDLHPTQFSLGMREVGAKTALINSKSADELIAYLKAKDVPIVIGPSGVAYMTDGHHTIRALLESNHPEKTVYGHVLANWSDLEPAAFWEQMRERNFTYLKDGQGRGPLDPRRLPPNLFAMEHDVYRGLAWAVMNAKGFAERKGVFFQEFFWADYFRDKVTWNDADDADFARAVSVACDLARAPAAASLPGYISNR